MTAPQRTPAERAALQARGVSTRRTILVALSQLGDAMVSEIVDASGLGRQLVEQQIEQLARLGAVERAGVRTAAKSRPRNLWRVTDLGRRAITEPALLVVRRASTPQETPASRERAAERERYRAAHAAHVERQRRLGIPEALIGADPMSAWGSL